MRANWGLLVVGSIVLGSFVTGCDGSDDPGSMDSGVGQMCAGRADGTSCGDGRVCRAEQCVAANSCGDGVVDPGESCDDGNNIAYDGCEPGTCELTCTDDAQCDDGSECSGVETCAPCADETCATGRSCASGTPLEDGTPCSDGTAVCRAGACVVPECGNGYVDEGESCDDGNTTPLDGCELDCRFTCEQANPSATNAWYPDCDGDGYAPAGSTPRMECLEPSPAGSCGWTLRAPTSGAGDCDDSNGSVHPGASEICDNIDNDCAGGVDNACIPCTGASQCASGFCVDGVCCDSACDGQCERCNLPGALGRCSPHTGDPIAPRPACASDHGTCGGTCNGVNRTSCTYPNGTSCGYCGYSGILTNRVPTAYTSGTCDGAGACVGETATSCGNYQCRLQYVVGVGEFPSCYVRCTDDSHCRPGDGISYRYYCRLTDNTCQLQSIGIGL